MVSPSRESSILCASDLTREFGGRRVVGPVDLRLAAGDRVALVGPNGSGKSTVLRCIAGTVVPTEGDVQVGGHPAGTMSAKHLLGVSLSQERAFYLRLSGRRNLEFFGRLRHTDRRAALAQVRALEEELEIQHITAKRLDRCSSGMLQQVSFARALLGSPRVLLLDEPTRSLDEAAVARLWAALDRRPETAVLIASHRPDDLEHCQRRIVLGA